MVKKACAFLKKHPSYNAVVHLITGVGLGVLITYPVAGVHPLRVGGAILAVGLCGHLYAAFTK